MVFQVALVHVQGAGLLVVYVVEFVGIGLVVVGQAVHEVLRGFVPVPQVSQDVAVGVVSSDYIDSLTNSQTINIIRT